MRLVFEQSSPVHFVSESKGGTLSVTQEQHKIPSFKFLDSILVDSFLTLFKITALVCAMESNRCIDYGHISQIFPYSIVVLAINLNSVKSRVIQSGSRSVTSGSHCFHSKQWLLPCHSVSMFQFLYVQSPLSLPLFS